MRSASLPSCCRFIAVSCSRPFLVCRLHIQSEHCGYLVHRNKDASDGATIWRARKLLSDQEFARAVGAFSDFTRSTFPADVYDIWGDSQYVGKRGGENRAAGTQGSCERRAFDLLLKGWLWRVLAGQ